MELRKVTESRRRYEDACGAAHALDLVGERWALLVMRELMLGPRRFTDLRADLPGISANVLTQRLIGLEETGIVRRRRLPPPAGAQVYELTPWGLEAEPIFQALGRWAARSPRHDPTLPLSAVSLLLSFQTMIDRQAAEGLSARIGLRMGEDFVAQVADCVITVRREPAHDVDALITGEPGAIAAVAYGGQSLDGQGGLAVSGDHALVARFLALFRLPDKAG